MTIIISMFGFNEEELAVLRKLDSPAKIQNFLDTMKKNFERDGDTCMSPRMVLRKRECHCIEGAMLACAAMRIHGRKPLVVDMEASRKDFDHVVAVFREHGKWGAISKTNYAVLRYREPVYDSIRELVMSYFHEYIYGRGRKTLRSYSDPVDLSRLDSRGWMTSEKDVWKVPEYLTKVKHHRILTSRQIHNLRRASPIEIKAGNLVEWKDRKKPVLGRHKSHRLKSHHSKS